MDAAPLRIAVVSSPRSGNTWLVSMLARLYGLKPVGRDGMDPDDWAKLPAGVVLQIHWPPEPEFAARLATEGFHVVTLRRHPLDTLLSILHFAWYQDDTHTWLRGQHGNEDGLRAAMPQSRSFVRYATGPRAAALLNVSADWWERSDVCRVRYEDLVADPVRELERIVAHVGRPPVATPTEVAGDHALPDLRRRSTNNHFWRGRADGWRDLLTAAEVAEIAAAMPTDAGYTFDADPDLTPDAADANWVASVGPELAATLRTGTDGHRAQLDWWADHARRVEADAEEVRRDRDAARAALIALRAELCAASAANARLTAANARLTAERDRAAEHAAAVVADRDRMWAALAALERELTPFRRLQRLSLRLAFGVQRLRDRFCRAVPAQ